MKESTQHASAAHGVVAKRTPSPLISIVVPVYSEEGAINGFLAEIASVLETVSCPYEIVFINDGSRDNTLQVLVDRSRADDHIRVINFSRNFGKEAALTAGIDHAAGDVLILMDVDLQDPPALIPRFLERWREGYDVVYGIRIDRISDTCFKRLTAKWFYRAFNRLAHIEIPENVGDFRLLDRRVADVLRQLPERNRFMKGLFAWVGFRSVGVSYARPPRAVGETKWGFWGLWNFALDGLVSFSTVPLRVWTYIGATVSGLAFLYAIFIVTRVLWLGVDVPGYASLLTATLFMGGMQLLSIGVIGEYLGRLFIETKARPIYVVEGVYRFGTSELPQNT